MSPAAALLLGLQLLAPPAAARAPLGASYAGGIHGFEDAPERLTTLRALGFYLVSFVPTYPYIDRDRIDFAGGPDWKALEEAVALALDQGFTVVLKPHLDPARYVRGYKPPVGLRETWRLDCEWRGKFDVDPMSNDYRTALLGQTLELLGRVLTKRPNAPAVRLEVGSELMASMIEQSPNWARLLKSLKSERRRLRLDDRVLLSYNFEHAIETPAGVVDKMTPSGRRALAAFIRGLDAVALSQYLDLTAAMPAAQKGKRLPSADEVARALVLHERRFHDDVLVGRLGLAADEAPPLHIGEFGVGSGGLKQPNVSSDRPLPAQLEQRFLDESARAHEGLVLYLSRDEGRLARSAVLWTLGRRFDIFGLDDPAFGVPGAARALRAYLAPTDLK